MTIRNKSITVYGRVQNVGFRYHALQTANKFGISGFVKNQADGSVYIESEAGDESLNKFLVWCKKGPAHASVRNIVVVDCPVMNDTHFQIKS